MNSFNKLSWIEKRLVVLQCKSTTEGLISAWIRDLKVEAKDHGDLEQVRLCELALGDVAPAYEGEGDTARDLCMDAVMDAWANLDGPLVSDD